MCSLINSFLENLLKQAPWQQASDNVTYINNIAVVKRKLAVQRQKTEDKYLNIWQQLPN